MKFVSGMMHEDVGGLRERYTLLLRSFPVSAKILPL